MADHALRLTVIWTRHEDGHGIPDDTPQFVAAFPSSLEEVMPELYDEWVMNACNQYRAALDAPVVAFYSSHTQIERLEAFAIGRGDVDLIENHVVNPSWEELLEQLHPAEEVGGA